MEQLKIGDNMDQMHDDPVQKFYAHSRADVGRENWQPLIEHLRSTAAIARRLGEPSGLGDMAYAAGLLHDLGKYSLAFQRRLAGDRRRVDHATAGAREVSRLFGERYRAQARILAYAIAGHHGGLMDAGSSSDVAGEGTLQVRLDPSKTVLPDYSTYQSELDVSSLTLPGMALKRTAEPGFSVSFLTRMLYSVLVDADWLETETFVNQEEKPRGGHASLSLLRDKFNSCMQRFDSAQSAIAQKRAETLQACRQKASLPRGIFTLTVPTGGGKTLSSIAFALEHAVRHNLRRVIYVIPFTSIIEQNAAVLKEFLGEENVLEHHSNFDWEQLKPGQDDETNAAQEKLRLAAENWDIPVVVTTNVQFFESLFANKKSRCRKLHNLANSVVIFDEAQTLPREYLTPCMLAVRELVLHYGVSAVFCTATQPVLQPFLPGLEKYPQFSNFVELADDPQGLFDFYRRVRVSVAGSLTDAQLLEKLQAYPQALCIVNTRRHARGLYDGLPDGDKFHLSSLMCPVHRKQVLGEVRQRLKDGDPCRVISTQVMEAGIDVDFPVGFRALSGLDSILQAAGRVNREGRLPDGGELHVFEPDTDLIRRVPAYIAQTGEAARSILREYAGDPTTRQAIEAYFRLLLMLNDKKAFDVKDVLSELNRMDGFNFKTAAEKFRLIENNMVALIVPFDDVARRAIQSLSFVQYPSAILRKLQAYSVNVYTSEYELLSGQGAIEMAAGLYPVLRDGQFYSPQTGINLPASDGGAAIFFD